MGFYDNSAENGSFVTFRKAPRFSALNRAGEGGGVSQMLWILPPFNLRKNIYILDELGKLYQMICMVSLNSILQTHLD